MIRTDRHAYCNCCNIDCGISVEPTPEGERFLRNWLAVSGWWYADDNCLCGKCWQPAKNEPDPLAAGARKVVYE